MCVAHRTTYSVRASETDNDDGFIMPTLSSLQKVDFILCRIAVIVGYLSAVTYLRISSPLLPGRRRRYAHTKIAWHQGYKTVKWSTMWTCYTGWKRLDANNIFVIMRWHCCRVTRMILIWIHYNSFKITAHCVNVATNQGTRELPQHNL